MTERLPIFPLNTVLFPGATLPLHVFEERYKALVHHLLSLPDRSERVFGIVAIREGYEVGSHGVHSLHRVGCVAQMTSVEPHADGRFDIEVVGRRRLRLEDMDASEPFPTGSVQLLGEDAHDAEAENEAHAAAGAFERYRRQVAELGGADVLGAALPRDPTYLSYTLAARCLLPLADRQALLEAQSAQERLAMLRHLLREESRAIRALPSLPATEISRTGWSAN